MRINYDFQDLEAFLAVKDTGSFQLAAERLNLSQSSVTRRIKKLETALNTLLFERTTRDVRPTLAAKRLSVRAEAILQDAQETTRAMRDETAAYAHQRAQTLVLAVVPTLITALVVPALRALQTPRINTRVQILDLGANEVAEAVAQGEADLGLCSIPMLEPVAAFTPLFEDPMVLAVPVGQPLAQHDALTWRDLEGAPLILPAQGTGNRFLIDDAQAKTGRPVRWTYEVRRSSTALDLVAQGIGVAPLPRTALTSAPKTVRAVPMQAPSIARPIGLVSRIGQVDTPPVASMKDRLRAAAHALSEEFVREL